MLFVNACFFFCFCVLRMFCVLVCYIAVCSVVRLYLFGAGCGLISFRFLLPVHSFVLMLVFGSRIGWLD